METKRTAPTPKTDPYRQGQNEGHYLDGHCAGFNGWMPAECRCFIFQPSYDRGYWDGCKAREALGKKAS